MSDTTKVALPEFAVSGKFRQGYIIDPDQNVFGIFEVNEIVK
jgi:hypothetical protein